MQFARGGLSMSQQHINQTTCVTLGASLEPCSCLTYVHTSQWPRVGISEDTNMYHLETEDVELSKKYDANRLYKAEMSKGNA